MSGITCFTSASFASLDRVRVLGYSLRRHHPDWRFVLCLSDRPPAGFVFDAGGEPIDRVVTLDALDIDNRAGWIFEHDAVELCTAVKGMMLARLLDEGAEAVVYLDPDVAVFAPLHEVGDLMRRTSIVLTPHQLAPDVDPAVIRENEIGSLKFGIFNLGFLAVANTREGRAFAAWWRDRLLHFCFDDVPNGLFTDQKWCDHVPVLFPDHSILRHPGYGVASWNLSRRRMAFDAAGAIRVGTEPLRFFHFTTMALVGDIMLERYAGDSLAVFELVHWYRAELKRHAPAGLPADWWAYGRFDDGRPIEPHHRTAYRRRADLRRRYPDPFAVTDAAALSLP